MSFQSVIGIGATPSVYTCDAVLFDGTNDYGTKADPVIADGTLFSFAFWIRRQAVGAPPRVWANTGGYQDSNWTASDQFQIQAHDSGGTRHWLTNTSTAITADSTWHHIMGSFNGTTDHLYLDGVSDKSTTTLTSATLDMTRGSWAIGASVGGASKANMDLADFWFTNEFIDFSSSANRELFRSSAGKPVDLGAGGITPTGTAAKIFLHIDDGATANTFLTDDGYTVTGALTTSSSSPSD
jgi:hypothetical protein